MEAVGLLGMLGICSFEDIKRRRIRLESVLIFGIAGLVMHLYFKSMNIGDIVGGMTIGVVLYLISVISHEKIGKGDALLICISGIYLGFWKNLMFFWIACLLAGVAGVGLLIRGKKTVTVPFVPFLLAAYILLLLVGGSGFVL